VILHRRADKTESAGINRLTVAATGIQVAAAQERREDRRTFRPALQQTGGSLGLPLNNGFWLRDVPMGSRLKA
jgi:hypothetical protein